MSEATKSQALAHAIAFLAGSTQDATDAIAVASHFATFIEGAAEAPAKTPARVATPAPKPKPKPKPKPAPEPEEAEGEVAEEDVTKDEVGDAIQALINADMVEEATALFTKYKAKSLGKLDPKYYEMVKEEAEALLPA